MVGHPFAVGGPRGSEVFVVAGYDRLHVRSASRPGIHVHDAGIQVQRPVSQPPAAIREGDLLRVGTPVRELRPVHNDPCLAAGRGKYNDGIADVIVRPVEEVVGHIRVKIVSRGLHNDAQSTRRELQFVDIQVAVGIGLVTRLRNRRSRAGQCQV